MAIMHAMLSVIIPIGRDDEGGRRKRALLEELYCIGKQSYRDYEVILVEQIHKRPIYEDIEVDKYISIKESRGFFNIPWGRNVGAREAEGEKHLHLDADLLFRQDYFRKVVDFGKEAFSAWSRCYYLTEQAAQVWLRAKSFDELTRDESFIEVRKGRQMKPNIWSAAGCAYCFDRNFFFNRFGGFNENFFGWGGDDNDAALRFSRLLDKNYHVLPDCTIYHMPHAGRKGASGGVTGGVGEWERTQKDPMGVTEKMLKANLGKREGPTVVK